MPENDQTVAELAALDYCFGAECKCGFKRIDLKTLPAHVQAMTVPEAIRRAVCQDCGQKYDIRIHLVSGFGKHL